MAHDFNGAPRPRASTEGLGMSPGEFAGVVAAYLTAMDAPDLTDTQLEILRHGIDRICDLNSGAVEGYLAEQKQNFEDSLASMGAGYGD